jgi:hypothetical protein
MIKMKKKINITFIAYSLLILLSGCPYKEVYKSEVGNIFESGVNIYPETVYHIEKKGVFSATFGFKINNTSNDTIRFRFDSSFLSSQTEVIEIEKVIYVFGNLLNPDTELVIPPMVDTSIALSFKGKFSFKKRDIVLHFNYEKIDVQIPYRYIAKK